MAGSTAEDDLAAVRAKAEEWQEIMQAGDTLVASLLQTNQSHFTHLSSLSLPPSLPPPPPPDKLPPPTATEGKDPEKRAAERKLATEKKEAVEKNREEAEQYRSIAAELSDQQAPALCALEQTQKTVEQQRAEAAREEKAVAATKGGRAPVGVKRVRGQPVVLVLMDASSALFDEGCIKQGASGGKDMGSRLRWQVEEDVRKSDIQLDEEDDRANAPKAAILAFVFHAKKALVGNLVKNRVISSERTWNDFIEGFTSIGNNQVMDTGSTPSSLLLAPLLLRLGPSPDVKLIYLAGVNVDHLREACPELDRHGRAVGGFYATVGPKLVLINHRESEEELQTLREQSGWRVTQFRRYFSSVNGLGADLGWGFRAPSPYIGPGDQKIEEGDDENGYADVAPSRAVVPGRNEWSGTRGTEGAARGWGRSG
ncbi:hypothetical protein JCM6882_005658 [Rhodosporidiobolus microsporus]